MIFALIPAAILLAAFIGWYVFEQTGSQSFLGFLCGTLLMLGSGFASIGYAFTIWSWFASEHKANIINREYSTSYTREEVFYASDVIETIRQLDRKRVEVNGDLFREKADK